MINRCKNECTRIRSGVYCECCREGDVILATENLLNSTLISKTRPFKKVCQSGNSLCRNKWDNFTTKKKEMHVIGRDNTHLCVHARRFYRKFRQFETMIRNIPTENPHRDPDAPYCAASVFTDKSEQVLRKHKIDNFSSCELKTLCLKNNKAHK